MSQSTTIALVLIIAWVIFVTAKGKLSQYMAIFGMTAGGGGGTASPGSTTAAAPGPLMGVLGVPLLPNEGDFGGGGGIPDTSTYTSTGATDFTAKSPGHQPSGGSGCAFTNTCSSWDWVFGKPFGF